MTKKIAFVTCSIKPSVSEDDQLAIPFLQERKIEVHAEAWDNPTTDWSQFDALVLRSCWNYHYHPQKFLQWLETLEQQGVKVINDIPTVKWNMHKSYLKELQAKGAHMAKTIWVDRGSRADVCALAEALKAKRMVVKPCVAATAYETFVMDDIHPDQTRFDELISNHDLIVQEFIDEVQTLGEWSLIFFDGKFSHAVIKKPKADDFRVQNDFGGTYSQANPPEKILKQASEVIKALPQRLAYARVDGVMSGDNFLLMELELIEPALFLSVDFLAPKRLSEAIQNGLS